MFACKKIFCRADAIASKVERHPGHSYRRNAELVK
jgi:hypothetical protein